MDYYAEQPPFGANDPYAPPPNKRPRGKDNPHDEETELKEKVIIPVDKFPGYNFVGSLLGPQGSILKGLQKATRAKMSIFGKGSMKDKSKEEELAKSEEAEHAHLKEPLHVLLEVKAPRAEAHWRMSNALIEVYKFMVPPDMRSQQMMGGGGQFNERQGGGGHFNEGPFEPYSDGGYGDNYMQGGGAPPRGGGGRGRPRGGPPSRGGGGGDRGGGGGGGPPRDHGAPRGGGRGARGGAPPQGNSPASRGVNRPRGGARPPPPQAEDQYSSSGYSETTNYQWDGNYSNKRTAEPEMSTSNGFTLKRFHDSYDDSY